MIIRIVKNQSGRTHPAAYESLLEAGDDLIALQSLGAPSTLNRSLLSTNIIENPYSNVRRKLGRVTRYRAETDHASRWLAAGLLEAEKGFRRIAGYADLRTFHELLRRKASVGSGDAVRKDAAPATTFVAALGPAHRRRQGRWRRGSRGSILKRRSL